jgi:hypothetical protein
MTSTYSPNETVATLYIFLLLSDYDREIAKNRIPALNPYFDTIIMPTEYGKYIEIPKELQKSVIRQWISSQTPELSNYDKENKAVDKHDDIIVDENSEHSEHCSCNSCNSCKLRNSNMFTSMCFLLLCLFVIFIIFYCMGSIRQKIQDIYNFGKSISKNTYDSFSVSSSKYINKFF